LSEDFEKLIKHISKNIVSKSKFSHLIAEELANINLKLTTKNATRWNSTLFMIRSVLKLTPDQLVAIKEKMPSKTKKQRKAKSNFSLSQLEREKILELKQLLEMFEFVTNELQSNKISISRVYPCVRFLQNNLLKNIETYPHTAELRKNYCASLMKRFGALIERDVFLVSTFLDPNFGLHAFEPDKKFEVKKLIKILVREQIEINGAVDDARNEEMSNTKSRTQKTSRLEETRKKNYIFYVTEPW